MITKVIINYIGSKIFEHRSSSVIKFIDNHLNWKKRNTWEDLFLHSYRMFKNCLRSGIYDEIILNSLLLHDIIEDGEITISEIQQKFGYSVSIIVRWMTWIDENKIKLEKPKYFKIFRKYCYYYWRILFVKLFDCIDNLKTIHWLNQEKQLRFIKEKKEIYLPIFEEYKNKVPYEMREIYIEKINELKTLLH